jgi:peptide chain release factor 2
MSILTLCQNNINDLSKIISVDLLLKRIEELDAQISNPTFWITNPKAPQIMKERQNYSEFVEWFSSAQEYIELCSLSDDLSDSDLEYLKEINIKLENKIFKCMMNDPNDNNPAILTISAGAGGLEAANWVSMLQRMYLRYAEQEGFSTEILDFKPSEEHSSICTDSVSVRIDGPYAYGFLKNESGVHRLIRNSPFNAGNARQTSFAAVYVIPDVEDSVEVKINEKDLEITCQTAGGPGGQAQNKISSAVRLKHIPSGINLVVRTERSQHDNRRTAMKMLKAKLYDIEMRKKQQEQDSKISQQMSVAFGSQIRTYTETPYQLTKDHRTKYEVNDFSNVLNGNIKGFILASLKA